MHLLLEPSPSVLRRVQPFAIAPRPLGLRHAIKARPSLLTRRVQQVERELDTPPAHTPGPTPQQEQQQHATPPPPTPPPPQHEDADTPSPAAHHAADAQPPSPDANPRLPPRPARQPQQQPEPRRPFPFQRPGAAAILATYGAYIGAVGTLAVGTAWATDVNLASMFRWSPEVLQTALLAFAPLAAFNTLIMLPDYSTWALPKLDGKDPEDAALLQSQGISPAKAADAQQQGTASPQQVNAAASAPADAAATSAASTDAASSSSSGSGSVDAQAGPSKGVGKVPASAWGQKKPPMRILKDAMHLAQGHYTANNPTVDVNIGVEVVTTAAQALAGEMLYRGVAITLLTEWLVDRLYEAGADDVMTLPLSATQMDTHDVGQWGAAWLLVGVSFALALRKVYAAPRPRIVTMVDLRQAARKQGGAGADADAAGPKGARDTEGPLKPRTPQPGWAPQGFQQVTTLAAVVQGARNVTQTLVFNCLFVATGGNLAATFTASLANQLLFSALQRQSMERMQKRSAALAKELEALNRRLLDIQKKKNARASAAATSAVAEAEAAPNTAHAASSSGAAPAAGASGLSTAAQQQQQAAPAAPAGAAEADEHLAVTAAVTAVTAAATGTPEPREGEALLHAAVASASAAAGAAADASAQPLVAAAAGAGAQGGASGAGGVQAPDQLTRALMALDLLLPAEPAKGQGKK